MATPGQLVKVLADALGIPAATVVVYDRTLVMAGLRSKEGHGRGAAHVTARDGANLVTAILGSDQVRKAAETVQRYSTTVVVRQASSGNGYRGTGIKGLNALGTGHSFVDAIEAILAAAASGELAEATAGRVEGRKGQSVVVPGLIEIAAMTPSTIGDIRIAGIDDAKSVSLRYASPTPWIGKKPVMLRKTAKGRGETARDHAADLEQIRRVSATTVFAIGRLLSERNGD